VRTIKGFSVNILLAILVFVSFGAYAQGQSGKVVLSGEAAVEIADFFAENRSELYYFIIEKQSRARTQVFFPGLPDAAFKSGARVRVTGKSRGRGKGVDVEALEILEPEPGTEPSPVEPSGGDPGAEAPVASNQTRKVLTLLVDFQDAWTNSNDDPSPNFTVPSSNAVTQAVVSAQMFNDVKNVQHFYNMASLDTLTIPTDPNTIGKEPIFGPYQIAYNYLSSSPGGATCAASTWADAALDLWEADTVNNPTGETRADYDSWSLIVPNYWDYSSSNGYTRACTWGGYAGVGCRQCWAFSADPESILFGVVIHELGHNFGFGHARYDTNNDGTSDCEYCDNSDLMGGSRRWMKFNAPHVDFQGWWDPVSYDIDTITPGSTQQEFDLIPMDEDDGPWPGLRAVKTPRTGTTDYYFSWRQRVGYYNEVNSNPYTSGVNIHWGADNNYASYFYKVLTTGEVFIDAGQDLQVRAIGTTNVDNGLGDTTDVFTIQVCNSTCSTLWPPLNLRASGAAPTTITLSWDDYTYNEDGWNIDYSTDGTSWSPLANAPPDATSYNHNGLSGGTTLYYRVRAYRGAPETSDWSGTVSATTPPASGSYEFPVISGDDDTLEYTSAPYAGQMYPTWSYQWLGYDSGNAATNDEGWRFQDVAIPQGATINSASIRLTAYGGSGDTTIRFRTEEADDAAPFTTASANLTSRTFGSSYVDWTLPASWSGGSQHTSPDLTAIVQPIINQTDWGGGNSMVFISQGQPDSPSGSHRVRTYNYGSSFAAVLTVDYTWTPPGPVPPTASFNHTTYSLDATFTDTSNDIDGTILGWDWDFGDGNTSTLQNPTHTYATSNTYTVSLTVTDNDAETGSISNPVTVIEDTTAPLITITGDNPAFVDQFETYTDAGATATDDLDGDLTSSISTTGLPVDTDTPGDVTVNYSVADGSGNVGSADRIVTVVANQAPTAGFSTSSVLLQVTFTDTSTDSDGTVVDWSWNFGDGNTSTQQSPVHSYASYDTYTVTLTVTDDDGATGVFATSVEVAPDQVAPVITLLGANPDSIGQYDTYTEPGFTASDDIDGDIAGNVTVGGWDYDTSIAGVKTLTYDVADASGNNAIQKTRDVTVVANQDPVAGFSHSISGLSVDFTDLSTDSDGSVDAWSWDFGDSGNSTNQNPTHVYTTDGNYTVTLTVTDDDGHTDQASDSFTLISPPNGLAATPETIDSIVLTWNDNSTAETGFEIERSAGGAGTWANIGTVTSGVATFTDSADLTDGSGYDYRVRATGPDGDSAYSATASVTSFECASSKTYNAGEWYQFALACDPGPYNTVTHIFDGPHPLLYRWDANAMSYVRLGPSDTMTPQMGYWVNFYYTTSYTQSGYDNINTDIPLVTDSSSGRSNLVGFHGTGSISWPDVRVIDGAQVKTLLEADPWENGSNPTNRVCDLATPTNKCLMSRKLRIWGGTKAAGSYQVYDPDVPGQEGSLVPLDGLWVDAFKSGVELRLPDPAAPAPTAAETVAKEATESASTKGKPEKGNKGGNKGGKNDGSAWYLRLIAESGSLRDPGNTLGQKPRSIDGQDSRDLEEPAPFLGDYLSILFTNPLFETVDWGFTTDFREPTDPPTGEWPFVVRTSKTTSSITLSWKADDYDFTSAWLIDEQTGERIAVTANGSYEFQPEGEESRFVIVIE